ncbi:MAG: ABC transporter substrate-binding protein [Mesorhizobium sp.]|uniref:ABC transporter substrate-binding protein n=1 Tax=Mesorhizobium sp. TaxID=1871066 RepID=UPI000FE9101C|nr:ABC transporter substrate-binding protein [Mesorhizobium sp.]RWI32353.1 MAG: ABC transporter substrate-binding protein [Mesorhizobium sp.]RWI62826.1 MAG: ABC transporter substrate-binding protein [Mesorhizobium sp.]RWI80366.1 MAG: ABC transporter substrate-binding protein [Mesorhizobium sp.]RWJ46758.1 MAG: ABC transporter substrate-binding protein [Mesorhizobium sp.]RWJ56671.1 MAG: ABC transporter substrate-binding protein [Mesorhizobium sp.]
MEWTAPAGSCDWLKIGKFLGAHNKPSIRITFRPLTKSAVWQSFQPEKKSKRGICMFSRRDILTIGAAAATSVIMPRISLAQSTASLVETAKAAGEDQVIISMGSGVYLDLMNELFFAPFTKESGIKVVPTGGGQSEGLAQLKAMTAANTVEWDLIGLSYEVAQSKEFKPFLEDLGDHCSKLPNVVSNGIEGSCFGTAVLWDPGGSVLTYDEQAFPNGGPQNWADFWDVEKFPGPRSLPNFSPWVVLMAALMADGVPADKLYPLDVDRAFAKLDKLKPNIAAWWTSGDQSQQLLRTKEVVASMLWNGRAARLKEEGASIKYTWDGAIFEAQLFGVIKGGPHPNAAKALLDFMYTRPEAHAAFIKKMYYSLPNKDAAALLDPAVAADLVTAPQNWPKVARMDGDWIDANRAAVTERWTKWITG